tara:strand:- start:1894 stop:2046 length:153 start_codon:yes stop_codon:yes gene_type:complete
MREDDGEAWVGAVAAVTAVAAGPAIFNDSYILLLDLIIVYNINMNIIKYK